LTAPSFGDGVVTTVDEIQTTVSRPNLDDDGLSITGGAGGSAPAPPADEPDEETDHSDTFSADTPTVSAASRFAAADNENDTLDIG
jgi:hypothetical protein